MTLKGTIMLFWLLILLFLGGLAVLGFHEIIAVASGATFSFPTNVLVQKLIAVVCLGILVLSIQLGLILQALNRIAGNVAAAGGSSVDRACGSTGGVTGDKTGDSILALALIALGTTTLLTGFTSERIIGVLFILAGLLLFLQVTCDRGKDAASDADMDCAADEKAG